MLIVHTQTKPPCWDRLEKEFKVQWVPGVYVTYGSEIYCFNSEIADEFLVHEAVHVAQQRLMDPEEYLEKYIADLSFRKKVEKEAFIVHDAYLRASIANEAELFTKLHRNRKSFARTIGCTLEEADQILGDYQSSKILP